MAVYRDVNTKFYKFLLICIVIVLIYVSGIFIEGYNFTTKYLGKNSKNNSINNTKINTKINSKIKSKNNTKINSKKSSKK